MRKTARPLMTALRLEATNQLRAWFGAGRRGQSALAVAGIAGALGAVMFLARPFAPALLRAAAPHLLTLSILVGFQASVLIHLARRKWTRHYSSNWLATLPVTRRQFLAITALRSLLSAALMLGLAPAAVLLARLCVPGSAAVTSVLLTGIGIATATGALLGWFLPARDTQRSDCVPRHAPGPEASLKGLAALSHWTQTQTGMWLQPRSLARLLLPAMLLLPMGTSGNVAIALLCLWSLAIYLFVLLRAMVHVARDGASWLRPTSVTFYRFAWAVARRPLFKQLQWTVSAAVLLIALGCQPQLAARVAEWWLALVTLTSGIALSRAYQSKTMRLRLIASVCVLAVLERFKQHLALPCALLISACYVREAART
ncbi:MAG: hypothetical protein ACHQD6_08150 [Steroidobacterales bacterium]|jgi:hypothetical protein